MIRYGSFFSKYIVKKNLEFLNFFKGRGRGRGNFFIILRYLKQLLLSKPCPILYLFKDRVANPTPLNKFYFEGGWINLFIPRTVSKHKIQLLPSKVCAFLHLLKGVANPHPLKKFFSK